MEYFLQQLINGLALDSIHVLIPIGCTMVYGTIDMTVLAHGDTFMFAALAAFLALAALGISASPLILFTSAWGWTLERLACGRLSSSFPLGFADHGRLHPAITDPPFCKHRGGPIQRSCSLRATPWVFEKNSDPCQSLTMMKPVCGISV